MSGASECLRLTGSAWFCFPVWNSIARRAALFGEAASATAASLGPPRRGQPSRGQALCGLPGLPGDCVFYCCNSSTSVAGSIVRHSELSCVFPLFAKLAVHFEEAVLAILPASGVRSVCVQWYGFYVLDSWVFGSSPLSQLTQPAVAL